MILYRPLKYFILYILITLSISIWGPRVYVEYNTFIVSIYMISFLVLFSIGYFWGMSVKTYPTQIIKNGIEPKKTVPYLKVCIIIALFIILFNFIVMLISGKISLSLSTIGQNYNNYYLDHNSGEKSSTIQSILFMLMGFPKFVTMVLGIYNFKDLSKSYRCSVITVFILSILTNTISIGNQKSLGDIVIYIMIICIIKMLDLSPIKRKKIITRVIWLGTLFSVCLSIIQYQRLVSDGTTIFNINERFTWRSSYNFEHIFFRIFGYKFGFGLAQFITGYLSGGYYGLSLCLQLPFVWTYGVGSSYSFMVYLDRFFGISSILDCTYLMRMERLTGWHGLVAWNTIFPWLASDLTFVGAIFIFIPIAYVYAVCWKEIVRYRNPVSILMFSMLTMGLIFIPANNQLLHGVDSFITTIVMSILWITSHKKYNFIQI